MANLKRGARGEGGGGDSSLDEKSEKDLVAELEEKLDRLRFLFEKYFLGIEKRAPMDQRAAVQRIIRYFQGRRINQTMVRFQFQTLVGRFNVFDTHWTRILRKIEDGTYERHLFKAKLRAEHEAEEGPAAKPAEEAPPEFGLREERMRQVFDDYLAARRECGESVEGMSYDKVRATLLREAPKIAEKNRVSRVDFQVVVRDGRAVLKAVPVKPES